MTSRYNVNYHLTTHKRDNFIEFIKSLLMPAFVLRQDNALYASIFNTVAQLVEDHREWQDAGSPDQSRLYELVPSVGTFFTSLPLMQAFLTYDSIYHVSSRQHVPPSFNDIRKILNIAQVQAVAKQVKLITFDGDETLYADGEDFLETNVIGDQILKLLKAGIHIAVVTAAGYVSDPKRYEQRLAGLLSKFRSQGLTADELSRFHVMGGECNYLFETDADAKLQEVSTDKFSTPSMQLWSTEQIDVLMDTAEQSFKDTIKRLDLPATIIRKARGVGLCRRSPDTRISRENLDEVVLRAKYALDRNKVSIPYCSFNGGADAWVDVGNKFIGVQAMQSYVKSSPSTTIHIGDQFLSTGNDHATRTACTTAWINGPVETEEILNILLSLVDTTSLPSKGTLAYNTISPCTPPNHVAEGVPDFKPITLAKPPASSMSGTSRSTGGNITIKLESDIVEPSDCIVMVGDKPALGAWSVFDAPALQRIPGKTNLFTIVLQPRGDEDIEFNFAAISARDQSVRWKSGDTHVLRASTHDITVSYTWK